MMAIHLFVMPSDFCNDGWLGSKCDLKGTCKGYEGYGEGVKILSNAVDTAVPAYCKDDGEITNDILNHAEIQSLS